MCLLGCFDMFAFSPQYLDSCTHLSMHYCVWFQLALPCPGCSFGDVENESENLLHVGVSKETVTSPAVVRAQIHALSLFATFLFCPSRRD